MVLLTHRTVWSQESLLQPYLEINRHGTVLCRKRTNFCGESLGTFRMFGTGKPRQSSVLGKWLGCPQVGEEVPDLLLGERFQDPLGHDGTRDSSHVLDLILVDHDPLSVDAS